MEKETIIVEEEYEDEYEDENGEWIEEIEYRESDKSVVIFNGYSERYTWEYVTHLGVDSGQLSIIPLTQFIDKEWDEKRYLQLSFDNVDGFLEDMFATSTDYGDGQYPLYIRYDKDNKIAGFYMEL